MPRGKTSSYSDLVHLAITGIDAQIAQLEQQREELAARIGDRTSTRRAISVAGRGAGARKPAGASS